MDVCTRLQRALNNEQYEVAKKLRERRDQVDSAMEKLIQAKNPGPESKQGITDVAAEGLRLRTELRRCIEEERYEDAAKVRDRLREVEMALANVSDASISGLGRQYHYTLGQIVLHREAGYRGVICGRDPKCFETEDWMKSSGSMSWERGIDQPFYLVLADAESWEMDTETIVVAYVPEENLRLPADDLEKLPVEHPYLYLLFLGLDGQGDLVPSKWLRERYQVERRDVHCHEDDLDEEEKREVDDDIDNDNN